MEAFLAAVLEREREHEHEDEDEDDDESMSVSRRQARLFAAQALYAFALEGSSIEAVTPRVADLLGSSDLGEDPFARDLCRLAAENLDRLDAELTETVEHWRPERLLLPDRAVLRLATCELLFFPDIPPRVTLDEYIEIADLEKAVEYYKNIILKFLS